MEPEVIKELYKKMHEVIEETKTLYELNEAEHILLTSMILQLPIAEMSPKLAARMLRACAHFLERTDDIAEHIGRMLKERG